MKVFTEKSDTLPKPKKKWYTPLNNPWSSSFYLPFFYCTGRFLPSNIINCGHLSQRLWNMFSSLQFLAECLALIATECIFMDYWISLTRISTCGEIILGVQKLWCSVLSPQGWSTSTEQAEHLPINHWAISQVFCFPQENTKNAGYFSFTLWWMLWVYECVCLGVGNGWV